MKLLLLSTLAAGALATYGSYGEAGKDAGGYQMEASYSMDASKSEQKNAAAEVAKPDESKKEALVVPISKNMGGSAAPEVISEAAASGTTHKIMVGGDAGLIFSPDQITAQVGDMVEFTFMQKNHTVTQSTFKTPCVKMADGLDSGFMPNDGSVSPAPVYTFQVKSTEASWFYCKQKTGTHCGKGMVFSINPTAEKSHETFKSMAMQQNGTDAAAGASSAAPADVSSTVYVSTPCSTSTSMTTVTAEAVTSYSSWESSSSAAPEVASSAPAPQSSAPVAIAQGTGSGAADSCNCQCLCAPAPMPPAAGDCSFGGWGGALPAKWDAMSSAPASAADAASSTWSSSYSMSTDAGAASSTWSSASYEASPSAAADSSSGSSGSSGTSSDDVAVGANPDIATGG
ncbi:MAG: hypothetical protein M1817_004008 [Caeruleum heppii]|nr:MAG: hypothetical protein M1817_004008 [Caeruleum heppii]